ncbi:ABC transporter permease [Amycolatopsis endophytica]|uniref:ABC-type nitrate/sulfonate/bicarbonate transport system permease component n=1 Tax=Amycolatopsis endophytica TaxID=860233 RepID=A0A853AXP0_9PSEU|nr:ABC transporter permease [Amycolatopsis endophytica]NYI87351.1 ABC-type nitrate/sulfonate/bicarbonate transport system permease component [Amycolatopsis endophytica]
MTTDVATSRRGGFSIRRGRDAVLGVTGLVIVVALLEILPRSGIIDARFLAPASEIARELGAELGHGAFWTSFGQTLLGWATGLALSMVAGTVVGVIIGSVPFLRSLTASTIEFLRPIPSVALIPLVVLIYGSEPQSALVLVVYASFWQVLVQVLYGVADVDPVVRDTARSYRFSRWSMIRTVIWPTALPYVVTGFRLAAAVALILEITAELIIGVPGLGRDIGVAQSSGAVPLTYALVIVVGLVGVAVNVLARLVERRVLRWHSSVRKDVG